MSEADFWLVRARYQKYKLVDSQKSVSEPEVNHLPNLDFERKLTKSGFAAVAGVDEVGRGAFAGPVVAAAVILPKNFQIPAGFADSKQVKPVKRAKFVKVIKREARAFSIAAVSVSAIDKLGLAKAVQAAFRKALRQLQPPADFVLVDAFYIRHFNRKNQLQLQQPQF